MPASKHQVLSVCRQCLAGLWVLVGAWLIFWFLRHGAKLELNSLHIVGIGVGGLLAASGSGLFFNCNWARISIGWLVGLAVLWSGDMFLFVAWRGMNNRQVLLAAAIGILIVAVATWYVLLHTPLQNGALESPSESEHKGKTPGPA